MHTDPEVSSEQRWVCVAPKTKLKDRSGERRKTYTGGKPMIATNKPKLVIYTDLYRCFDLALAVARTTKQ